MCVKQSKYDGWDCVVGGLTLGPMWAVPLNIQHLMQVAAGQMQCTYTGIT